jgi:hypothetical protein
LCVFAPLHRTGTPKRKTIKTGGEDPVSRVADSISSDGYAVKPIAIRMSNLQGQDLINISVKK